MSWKVVKRRIYSLGFTHDKKKYHVEVGGFDPFEHNYEVLAILESNTYLIYGRRPNNGRTTTILVNKAEVDSIVEFTQTSN
jgi:hypothetical protein